MAVKTSLLALWFCGSLLLPLTAGAQPDANEDASTASSPPADTETPPAEPPSPSTSSAEPTTPAPPPSTSTATQSAPTGQPAIPLSESKAPQQHAPLISNTAIVGATVKNSQGEKLGNIREIMIDPQTGRVAYVLLTSSDMLGMNEKSLAIPWEALRVGLGQNELVVEVDNSKLSSSAPTYEMSQR
jgi:sporulation protein YlmC with PRC-barrel domain